MKFINLFKRTKDDYKEEPISERYNEGWMYKRNDEGPPTKDTGSMFNLWWIVDLATTLIRKFK